MIVHRGGLDPMHPLAEDIAAWIDRRVDRPTRARLAAHFAACAECRAELGEACALLDVPVPPLRAAWAPRVGVLAASAAGIAALLLVVPLLREPASVPRYRAPAPAAAPEGIALIEVAEPTSPVPATGEHTFAWRGTGPGALYRFTLTDAQGDVIFTATTARTLVRVPAGTPLTPGHTYYWHVDALLDGVRTATTRVQPLEVR